MERLEDQAELATSQPRELIVLQSTHVDSCKLYRAGSRRLQPGGEMNEGALARAARTGEHHKFGLPDREGDMDERVDASGILAEGFGDVVEFEDRPC